jgi:hypothetical protein
MRGTRGRCASVPLLHAAYSTAGPPRIAWPGRMGHASAAARPCPASCTPYPTRSRRRAGAQRGAALLHERAGRMSNTVTPTTIDISLAPSRLAKGERRPMSAEQRAKLSAAQRAYVANGPRWMEHRRKLAAAQEARRMTLMETEVAAILEMRRKGRRRARRGRGFWRCFD